VTIGVDLAGLLEGRMASAEGGSVLNGVQYGEGCPLSSRLRGLGSVVSGVRGRAPAENEFWRILKATERPFLYLYDKIWGGAICISVPPLQVLGDLSPLSLVIYAHECDVVHNMYPIPAAHQRIFN